GGLCAQPVFNVAFFVKIFCFVPVSIIFWLAKHARPVGNEFLTSRKHGTGLTRKGHRHFRFEQCGGVKPRIVGSHRFGRDGGYLFESARLENVVRESLRRSVSSRCDQDRSQQQKSVHRSPLASNVVFRHSFENLSVGALPQEYPSAR